MGIWWFSLCFFPSLLVGMEFISNGNVVKVQICPFVNLLYSYLPLCKSLSVVVIVKLGASFVVAVEFKLLSLSSSTSTLSFYRRRVQASVTIIVAYAINRCSDLRRAMASREENDGAMATEGDDNQLLYVGVHHGKQLLQSWWWRAITVTMNPKP